MNTGPESAAIVTPPVGWRNWALLIVPLIVGLIAQRYFGDVPVNVMELKFSAVPVPAVCFIHATSVAVPDTVPDVRGTRGLLR